MRRWTCICLLAVVGCSDPDQDCPEGQREDADGLCVELATKAPNTTAPTNTSTSPSTSTNSNTTTGSTWTGPCSTQVRSFSLGLDYGWDDSLGQFVSVDLLGTSTEPVFWMQFGELGWNGDSSLGVCTIGWSVQGMPGAAAPSDVLGVTIDTTSTPLFDTCADGIATGQICADFFTMPPGVDAVTASYTWRASNALPESGIADQLAAYFDPDTYWEATVDSTILGYPSDSYSFGFTVDGSFAVVGSTPDIYRSGMETANGQIDGYYRVVNPFIWTFQ